MSTPSPKSGSPSRQRTDPPPGYGGHHHNQPVHVPAGALAVGRILGPHSLSGELRVEVHTDFPERFAAGSTLLLGDDLVEVEIHSARPHKSIVLVRFAGVDSRSAAEALAGRWLFIAEADAVDLDPGAFWIHDLIGLTVQTGDGIILGTLTEVMATGANDVYIIQPPPTVNQGREFLLPAISDVIRSVDLDARLMTIELLPGLLEP
jgi:16S rRNA processing protein RimM